MRHRKQIYNTGVLKILVDHGDPVSVVQKVSNSDGIFVTTYSFEEMEGKYRVNEKNECMSNYYENPGKSVMTHKLVSCDIDSALMEMADIILGPYMNDPEFHYSDSRRLESRLKKELMKNGYTNIGVICSNLKEKIKGWGLI